MLPINEESLNNRYISVLAGSSVAHPIWDQYILNQKSLGKTWQIKVFLTKETLLRF